MLLQNKIYSDPVSNLNYKLNSDISLEKSIKYLITGENGVGKSRFAEGVLLKELKSQNLKTLYFSQDIDNQILSFELISLVKKFISILKESGTFLKTVLFNDDSHNSIELDFNSESVLNPNNKNIKDFIIKECYKYKDTDVLIFDEVDKYFNSHEEFTSILKEVNYKALFVISHIVSTENLESYNLLHLTKGDNIIEITL